MQRKELSSQQWERMKEAVRFMVDHKAENVTGSRAGITFGGSQLPVSTRGSLLPKIPSLPKIASAAGNNT